MKWLRWYSGTVTDPKWRVVAAESGQPLPAVIAVWAAMLEAANEADNRGCIDGWRDRVTAAALDLAPEAVAAIRSAMQGLVLEGDALTGWEKRQPMESTERVRRHRARKQKESPEAGPTPPDPSPGKGGNAMKRDETRCNEGNAGNALEESRVEESRVEKNSLPSTTTITRLRESDSIDPDLLITEIVRAANRGMIDNPALGAATPPIPAGHGSRQHVADWLDADIPADLIRSAVYASAAAYRPQGSRRSISTMAYFAGAVHDAHERWKASQTEIPKSDAHDHDGPRDSGAPSPRRGEAPQSPPDRYAHLIEGAA